MIWNLEEAISYYQSLGAPGDQNAVVSLLREVQQESGGRVSPGALSEIAQAYGIKESYLSAIIHRIPSLRLADTHCLEICGGPNCSKRAALAAFVEKTYGSRHKSFTLKASPCMRMCGKGPNIKWDGKIYHQADEELIRRLVQPDRHFTPDSSI